MIEFARLQWRFVVLGAICFVALSWFVVGVRADDPPAGPPDVANKVITAVADAQGEPVRVIVLVHPDGKGLEGIETAQKAVLDALPAANATVNHQYKNIPAFAASIDQHALATLSTNPRVAAVQLDTPTVAHMNEALAAIGGVTMRANYGLTGEGVTVAVLDTGIDTDNTDFSGRIVAQKCFLSSGECPPSNSSESSNAEDGNGHGTHVSGIIASAGVNTYEGVAPKANLVAVKVLSDSGSGWTSDWVSGLDWVYDNRVSLGIDLVNMSLGTYALYGGAHCDAQESAAASIISQLASVGIPVFAASGNNGSSSSLAAPGCVSAAVSVGAVYDTNLGIEPDSGTYRDWYGDSWPDCRDLNATLQQVTCFSNSYSSLELLAPGAWVTSSFLGNGAVSLRGTSMASPMAAGAAAILFEANPSLSVNENLTLLQDTGVPVTDSRNGVTTSRIDIAAAVTELYRQMATSTPTPTPIPPTPTPLPTPTNEPLVESPVNELYVTFDGAGSVRDVTYGAEDVLHYVASTGQWSLYFDGSNEGLAAGTNVSSLMFYNGRLAMTFAADTVIPNGVNGNPRTVTPRDIVLWRPWDGVWFVGLTGADYGLTTGNTDLDAMTIVPGKALFSTAGLLPAAGAAADDLSRLRRSTSEWALEFDGSAIPVMGGNIVAVSGDLSGALVGNLFVAGSGDASAVYRCESPVYGIPTSCVSFTKIWDAVARGVSGNNNISGLIVDEEAGIFLPTSTPPPPTATPIPTETPIPPTITPTPTPTITPIPPTATPVGPPCVMPSWNSATIYMAGDRTSHQGRNYTAKWWTQGAEPPDGGSGVWTDDGPCAS